ncbi:MAG: radical SAM protein, partial [Actinomycetota bacterium]
MTSSGVRVEFGRDLRPTTAARPQSMDFHVLAKPSGAICNLDCTYCFFLEKADLYPGGHFRMDRSVLERYLEQLLEIQRGPEITISWQGGEPTLLGVEWFRYAVEVANRVAPQGTVLHHTIQTNATLITDE